MFPVATWQGFRPGMIDRREHHQRAARVHRLALTSHRYRITEACPLPGVWNGHRIRPALAIDARPQATREGFRITLEGSPRPGVWNPPGLALPVIWSPLERSR